MSNATQMVPGVAQIVVPGVRRLLAPNPSAMTGPGTNTYLLGQAEVAVIDPGPDDLAHLDAILAAAGSAPISHIFVTHAHRDHSALAPALAEASGAPVLAFGPPEAGRSDAMRALAVSGLSGGGEGVDSGFSPDITLSDNQRIAGTDWALSALHTPGHFSGHLSFCVGDANDTILTGDTVLGWTSTLISPPDGDLGAFMATCAHLKSLGAARFLPGHGPVIDDPDARLTWLIAHRRAREADIRTALDRGPATPAELVATVYTDIAPALHPMAERNVLAHLVDLHERNLVEAAPDLTATATFRLR